MQTKLDKFGRVVIPKSVRQNLGLKPGEILQLEESGEKIIIKPDQKEECLSLKDGILVFAGNADGAQVSAGRVSSSVTKPGCEKSA